MTAKIYGCKLLQPDHTSINGRYTYRYGWNDVPGNGAYIAVTGGVDSVDIPVNVVIRWFECDPESEFISKEPLPLGVRCFWRVRMLRRKPKGVLPLAVRRGQTIVVNDYYLNGQQAYRGAYRYGQLHGVVETWRLDGSRFYREKYSNGLINGTYIEWRKDGSIKYRHKYRDGERIA